MQIIFNQLKKGDYFTSLNIPDQVGTCIVANEIFTGLIIIINNRADVVGPGHFIWDRPVKLISRNNDVEKYDWSRQLL